MFLLNFAGPAEGRRCGCAARGSFYQRRHWSPSTTLRRGGARSRGGSGDVARGSRAVRRQTGWVRSAASTTTSTCRGACRDFVMWCVHGLAQRRRLLEFADKIFARASIRSRSHEERASCACSCGILASDARGTERPVPRHPYNPEEGDASRSRRQQLRPGSSRERQAVAGRSGGSVGVRSGVGRLVRRSAVLHGASISLSDKDIEMFTGVLVVRKVAAGSGMILEGDPAELLARGVGQVAGTTHLTRPARRTRSQRHGQLKC